MRTLLRHSKAPEREEFGNEVHDLVRTTAEDDDGDDLSDGATTRCSSSTRSIASASPVLVVTAQRARYLYRCVMGAR